MFEQISIPDKLVEIIGSENKDFAVKGGLAQPAKNSVALIIFSLFWLAFTSIFFFAFIGPVLWGDETTGSGNFVMSSDGVEGITVPAIVIGLFAFVGFSMLALGLGSLFKKGGWFAGTPTRLINYTKNSYRSIDWEQFSGDIQVRGNEKKGTITLGMRTGRMVSSKGSADRFVPDVFYMTGIPDVYEIEQICRRRIKENDPTPAIT